MKYNVIFGYIFNNFAGKFLDLIPFKEMIAHSLRNDS